MKACILEIRGNHAAALTDDGSFIKIRNRNYKVGQAVERKNSILSMPTKIVGIAAACAAIVFVLSIARIYFTPYAYVSLDVNPSIEYCVNQFNRVLNTKAVDSDATQVLNGLNLNNKTINDAIDETVSKIKSEGFFKSDDPGGIVISTSCDNTKAASQLADQLKLSTARSSGPGIEVEAISVDKSKFLEAKKYGTTPGKLNLVKKLQASAQDSGSINVQEWLKKPVKDIMRAMKDNQHTNILSSKADGKDVASRSENEHNSDNIASESPAVSSPEGNTDSNDESSSQKISSDSGLPSSKNSWGTSHEAPKTKDNSDRASVKYQHRQHFDDEDSADPSTDTP